ncbi:MAG: glycosyltransferase family 2 protein, partial [bacterium]
MLTTFIITLCILLYAWVLYPALILALGRLKKPHPLLHKGGGDDPKGLLDLPDPITRGQESSLPPVTFIFSAHNEEPVIGARLSNLLFLDYPRDRIRIYVGVDGSSDKTEEIARHWQAQDNRVQVFVQNPCRGKTTMLKRLAREVGEQTPDFGIQNPASFAKATAAMESRIQNEGEGISLKSKVPPRSLLVFTDANTMYERDALLRLVAPFADPQVGGVCGKLVFEKKEPDSSPAAAAGTDEPVYWDMETRMKEAESRLDSCLGANGAIYAIRAGLFPFSMPDNTIIDDFVIGMKVREQGYRMVFEPAALAHEDLPETMADEWRRRIRIGSGGYQALSQCRSCLSPRYGLFAWFFWSHKVLRWFTPHLLLVALAAGAGWLAVRMAQWEGWRINLTAVGVMLVCVACLCVLPAYAQEKPAAEGAEALSAGSRDQRETEPSQCDHRVRRGRGGGRRP